MTVSYPLPDRPPEGDQNIEVTTPESPFSPEIEPQGPPERIPPTSTGDLPGNTYMPKSLTQEDERTWAMLAHLSILLNLITGFLGPVAAILIYAVYRDRSRYVAYHAMQSFVWQLVTWVGAGFLAAVAWTISGILVVILIGCLLMPLALLISVIPLAALVYGVVGAIQVNNGQDFRYPLVGDWVRGTLTS